MKKVIVRRKWNESKIDIVVSNSSESISIEVDLEDFLIQLTREVGNPMKLLTEAGMLKSLRSASGTVVTNMKKESVVVI